jgi:AcrR family transcriptional regulator
MPRPSRRDDLVRTAIEVFAECGFHAAGIDLLLDRAGVSKKTLYNHFASKDELVVAALETYGEEFLRALVAEVGALQTTPTSRLLAVFDVADRWFASDGFHGCLFINAVGEFSAQESPVRAAAERFKRRVRDYLLELVTAVGVRDGEGLADELALLLEGAIVTAQVSAASGAAATARKAAATLVESSRRRSTRG